MSPKRIGILTRHCYPNYGSLLQTVALQTALEQAGARATVIDYVPSGDYGTSLVEASLRESRMSESASKRLMFRTVQGPNLMYMSGRFRSHQTRLLPLTETYRSLQPDSPVWRGLDSVVTGSDQVWAPIHERIDPVYFLDRCDASVERHSYAASLGGPGPRESDRDAVHAMLRRLDSISTRERSATDGLVASDLPARTDVDPTILLGKDFWTSFAGPPSTGTRPYVMAYQLHSTPGFTTVLRQHAESRGLPIRRVSVDAKQATKPGKLDYLARPELFVRRIRDAAVLVTDSFHGAVFGLTFGVPTVVVPPAKHATRLTDLLDAVGLGRLVATAGGPAVDPIYDKAGVSEIFEALRGPSWGHVRHIAGLRP